MHFPARFKKFTPEGYPDLVFQIRVNPTNAELMALVRGAQPDISADDDEDARSRAREAARQAFGHALVAAFAGAKVEAYGATFDFTTPEKALDTMKMDEIPDDLAHWLRNAPVDVVIQERESITKNYRTS
jgi:hypothetical protein